MLCRVEQDHVVAIEKARIAFDQHDEIALVAKAQPGAAIADRIGVHRLRGIQRRTHAAADVAVPGPTAGFGGIDPRHTPEAMFECVGAALVAARDKRRLCAGDRLQRRDRIVAAGDMCRIGMRPDHDEIVPGDLPAVDAMPAVMNFCSASGSCTRTRSASSRAAV